MEIQRGNWIALPGSSGDTVPVFRKKFSCEKPVRKAKLEITAAGVYEAELNGNRVGRFILAPGWTEYGKRIQVQTYDITGLLLERNILEAVVGRGWFRRSLPEWTAAGGQRENMRAAMIACLKIEFEDGSERIIPTDETWEAAPSGILVSGIFEGETVVTICPWQLYWTYGDEAFLANQFDSMKAWVNYITSVTTTPYLWTGGNHYGDWLGLDSPPGSFKGATDDDLIATAFYARSAELLAEAGKILGRDMEACERLYRNIVSAFRTRYGNRLDTQTAKVLAIHFHLAEDPQSLGDALARQIKDCGTRLQTGFIGTAYVMHALSETGHTDLAWSLLLRKEYPSWLYAVTRGATTVWEHWDSIREDGTFWSDEMNSFNHYAYGAVADWVYEVACGIRPKKPGFAEALIAPNPDARAGALSARIETVHGEISCAWRYTENRFRVEISTCVPTEVRIGGNQWFVGPGSYVF